MCGRYATTMDPETLFGVFHAEPEAEYDGLRYQQPGAGEYGGDIPRPRGPRYNIAPTDPVPIVRMRPPREEEPERRVVSEARWGLVPSWAKDLKVGSRMFNARAESLLDKPAFRRAFDRRRCLVPASGYFEWRKLEQPGEASAGRVKSAKAGKVPKQPFYIAPADGSVMAFAGLWEFWKSPDGEPVVSTSIITVDAIGPLEPIHDRMPLILPASEWDEWLDRDSDGAAVSALVGRPSLELIEGLELRPVGPRVGNVRNDDPELLQRVEPLG